MVARNGFPDGGDLDSLGEIKLGEIKKGSTLWGENGARMVSWEIAQGAWERQESLTGLFLWAKWYQGTQNHKET